MLPSGCATAPTDNNARLFKQGQDNVLAPLVARGDIEVLHEDWAADWSPADAKKIMNAAITSHDDIDAVLASNDGTAGGAIQSLKEAQLAGTVVVTGQDADLVACQRIMAGTQSMTVYKPVHRLARRAAELAVDLAAGRPVVANGAVDNGAADSGSRQVPAVLLEVVAVTRENLMDTVVAEGFHSAEEVSGLLNGMTLLAVSPEIKFIARGTVLMLAVWMDVWIWRKRS